MLRFVALIACFGILLAIPSRAQPQKRISGGSAASILDHPYQVSVNAYGKYECSGAIISRDWVLTTIHCTRFPQWDLSVRSGTNQLQAGGKLHRIAEVVQHDHYMSQRTRFNDVALLKVEEPFEFDETTQSIELVEAKISITEGYSGVISGWGTKEEGKELPTLEAVHTDIMSLSDCVDVYYSRFGSLMPGVLCAKNEKPGGTAACSEIWAADDSGAPLVVDGRLAGVFSWGYRCHYAGFPSVFMEVAYFRDWIKRVSGV